ncbi:MAG: MASE1 domain-containing protein [bacterium]
MRKSLNSGMIFRNFFISLLLIAVIIIDRQFFSFSGMPPIIQFSAAIGLVMVIIKGKRLLYGIGIGSFTGLFINNYLLTDTPITNSLTAALLYAVSLILYIAIVRSITSKNFVSTVMSAFKFILSVLLFSAIFPIINVIIFQMLTGEPVACSADYFYMCMLSIITPVLIIVPLFVYVKHKARITWSTLKLYELLLYKAMIIIASTFLFFGLIELNSYSSIVYLIAFFIIWINVRFGRREAFLALFITGVMAITGFLYHTGPFYSGMNYDSYLELLIFLFVISTGIIIVASVKAERKSLKVEVVQNYNDYLEHIKLKASEYENKTQSLKRDYWSMRDEISQLREKKEELENSLSIFLSKYKFIKETISKHTERERELQKLYNKENTLNRELKQFNRQIMESLEKRNILEEELKTANKKLKENQKKCIVQSGKIEKTQSIIEKHKNKLEAMHRIGQLLIWEYEPGSGQFIFSGDKDLLSPGSLHSFDDYTESIVNYDANEILEQLNELDTDTLKLEIIRETDKDSFKSVLKAGRMDENRFFGIEMIDV